MRNLQVVIKPLEFSEDYAGKFNLSHASRTLVLDWYHTDRQTDYNNPLAHVRQALTINQHLDYGNIAPSHSVYVWGGILAIKSIMITVFLKLFKCFYCPWASGLLPHYGNLWCQLGAFVHLAGFQEQLSPHMPRCSRAWSMFQSYLFVLDC